MVPVLRSADKMGLADIEKEIIKLGTKAREGKRGNSRGLLGTLGNSGGIWGNLGEPRRRRAS